MLFNKKEKNAEAIADTENDTNNDTNNGTDTIKSIYSWVETFVLVPIIVVFLFTFVLRTSVVSGTSMLNTLHERDMILISDLFYKPQYGDIVVLTQPSFGTDPIVKRVIATAGQTVDIDFEKGVVFVDGSELREPYTFTPTNVSYDTKFPLTVKEGFVFVLGDNRNGSYDSRGADIGQVDERMIMGKAYVKLFPIKDFKVMEKVKGN
ncbi:MAG: signal peptidase I [Oscillospiraceae bacterium]